MTYDNEGTGMRIKHFRNSKQLSQEYLAEKIGVTQEYIARIEAGKKIPSLELFVSIANALETSSDHLLADSLIVLRSEDEKEYYEVFSDCTHDERAMLLRMLKFFKALLSEYGI
ncbi:MAG: helix-turn-helix transcriptional regulator [Clostridiales bacterium]|nr:helix-turn-helix transcriptional regulator [Clostridiales bacterium]MBR0455260.1 helix-turn-helix transcriptional regulator [Bacillota bacterium]